MRRIFFLFRITIMRKMNDMGILLIEWRYRLLIFFLFLFINESERLKLSLWIMFSLNRLSIVNFVTVIYWFIEIWNFMIYFSFMPFKYRFVGIFSLVFEETKSFIFLFFLNKNIFVCMLVSHWYVNSHEYLYKLYLLS